MSSVRYIEVLEDDDGQRLERWLKKQLPDAPYTLLQKMIRKGQLRVDGKRAKPDTRLSKGQQVRVPPFFQNASSKRSSSVRQKTLSDKDIQFIRSLVLYDDEHVIALNKPSGLAVQGGTNTKKHIDGLLDGLINEDGVRPRLVHRLDKETSGILLLARSSKSAQKLGTFFKNRKIKKIYWAILTPVPEISEGVIRAPLLKKTSGKDKERVCVDENGKPAVTEYAVLDKTGEQAAFVAFWPRTGRTHQIRVHAADVLNCPVLGDRKYSAPDETLEALNLPNTLHLHARRIICPHPVKQTLLDIEAPLPDDLTTTWKTFNFDGTLKDDPFEHLS